MKNFYPLLKKMPLFNGINENELSGLLQCLTAKTKKFDKMATVFMVGDVSSYVGVVLSGAVQVVKEDFLGNRTILAKLEAGELFGEAFACGKNHILPVNVYTVEKSEILMINYRKMITTCTSSCVFHNKLIENMLGILADKNQMLNQKIEILSRRSTREKLIAYLTAQAQKAGSSSFMIPFNRQELADYLCVDRSAMTNEIRKLREEGTLQVERNHFELLHHN